MPRRSLRLIMLYVIIARDDIDEDYVEAAHY